MNCIDFTPEVSKGKQKEYFSLNQNGIADTIDPEPYDIHATIDPDSKLPKLPAIDIRGPFRKA